jgi:hypothetical protein
MSSKQEKDTPWSDIMRRLDALIALQAQPTGGKIGQTIATLRNAGLRPIEISRILGKSLTYVTATLAIEKKSRRRDGSVT